MNTSNATFSRGLPRSFTDEADIGCYECSQRRINCDRGEPACAKCISKGLECSGLGVRYRFSKYAAVRGKWADKQIEAVYEK